MIHQRPVVEDRRQVESSRPRGDLGTGGDPQSVDRLGVLDQLFKTKNRSSVLGTYSFDKNGDTSLTDYGIYKVGADGNPTFSKAIKSQG